MDFIEGLPKSLGKSTILVVVDRLSKFAHFIPLSHPFTVKTVVASFTGNVYKLYGLLRTIVSDRDNNFTSESGKNCGHCKALSCISAHHSTHKQMDRLR